MNFKEIAQKKVLGIPVIYLGVVFAGVIAFIAWKMKPAANTDTSADVGTDGAVGSGDAGSVQNGDLAGSVYDSLKTQGTVVVAPTPATDTTDTTIKTNSTWVSDGIQWLVANDKASGTVASAALNKYILGQDRSFDEDALVNLWIKQGGPPPDGVEPAGTIGSKPAQKQFPQPPGVHTVTGSSDNGYNAMLDLYYGGRHTQEALDLLQAANEPLGLSGPWGVGTKINIPVYHSAKMYVLPSDMTVAQICSKNGITPYQFNALNNTSKQQWKKGNTVRVA